MKINIGPYPEGDEERNVSIEIEKFDTWNMDHTLSMIILPMLKQLKGEKHGAPNVDDEDVPDDLKSTSAPPKVNEWDTDDNHFKRWDWVMDEMIWAFQHKIEDNWSDMFFTYEEPQYQIAELQSKGVGPAQLRLFPDEHGDMEDYELYELIRDDTKSHFDKEGYDKYQKRITNGVRLFGKYFESLWD